MTTAIKLRTAVIMAALGLLGISGGIAGADTDVDLSGSHRGEVSGTHERIDLLMRPLAADHRSGSYLGVLIQHSGAVSIYLIDKDDGNRYTMTPREVSDGEVLGTVNMSPTLFLNVQGHNPNGRASFNINGAHSDNKDEFQGAATFDGDHSPDYDWPEYVKGKYRNGSDRRDDINMPDCLEDNQTSISLTMPGIDGDYIFREKLTGIYTLEGLSASAGATQYEQFPKKLAIFLHRNHWYGGSDYRLVLVDPNAYNNVFMLNHR